MVQNGKALEVNRRAVLAGRNIGIGHTGLPKFAGTMNMPPPMNENAYRDHVAAMNAAAELICKESMSNASQQTKLFYEVEEDGKYDIGISADGTWRHRGYSSSYGVVPGISLVTGKVLNVEIMSKECRECVTRKRKEGTEEFQECGKGININGIEILKGHQVLWMLLDVLLSLNDMQNSMACITQSFLEIGIVKHSIWLQKKMFMRM